MAPSLLEPHRPGQALGHGRGASEPAGRERETSLEGQGVNGLFYFFRGQGNVPDRDAGSPSPARGDMEQGCGKEV